MADEEELELDVNQAKSSKKTLIIIVAAVLILNLAGIGAWLVLGGGDDKAKDKVATQDDKKEADLGTLKYLTMVPEFVVNFGPGSKVRYLMVDLQIATRDDAALSTVGTYRPVLRNDILVDLSSVRFDDLKHREGKEALQKKLLNTINRVVNSATHVAVEDDENNAADNEQAKDEDAKGPITNVYFTSFIMQ